MSDARKELYDLKLENSKLDHKVVKLLRENGKLADMLIEEKRKAEALRGLCDEILNVLRIVNVDLETTIKDWYERMMKI